MDRLEKAQASVETAKEHLDKGEANGFLLQLQIAQTQAWISIAEQVKRVADHVTGVEAKEPTSERPPPSAYL